MGMDARALVGGPRGRRVLLEIARGPLGTEPHPLATAVFWAAYRRAREAGEAVSLVTVTDGDGEGSHERPAPSGAEIAALLAEQPSAPPTAEDLDDALEAAVDSARYWQGPDGEDRVASDPELAPALLRTAHLVAGSPHTDWWATGLDRASQCEVLFEGMTTSPRIDSRAVLRKWTDAAAAEEAFWRRSTEQGVAMSGTWWSTPPHGLRRTTRASTPSGIPVGLRLIEDRMGWTRADVRRIGVAPSARVVEIDGPDAWADLVRRYPLDVTASRRADWARATDRHGRWLIPDWARVAADAVHVSVAGYLATAGRALDLGDGWGALLAGWGPDETVWLNDGVLSPEPGTRPWSVDGEGRRRCP
ncbi:hypothetical protein IT072_06945 [Leifsonia sp. ZF2019]|uniref:hypothetical protein n=1 Tax=Leifsonia sp. ZF2019 TaxID=2781978 RepID=UPI001CBF923D|nr:hypothetical protein [Leifsonia sp. ZF2019]UAJ80740.1 hypothetical protein IT072_06945 [Leifsonia sp. ZF2019]